jgi:hypothetical protein
MKLCQTFQTKKMKKQPKKKEKKKEPLLIAQD